MFNGSPLVVLKLVHIQQQQWAHERPTIVTFTYINLWIQILICCHDVNTIG
jgi:hypothetical protein